MDLEVLKKKLGTFRGDGGRVRGVSDELLMELLQAWEQWTEPASGFARAIGMNRSAIPKLIGKAKRLRREGHFPADEFKEIKIADKNSSASQASPCGIEIAWDGGRTIRFLGVDQLVDFLKKVA